MIDIHTHIIHGVDDGSDTLEESVAILNEAVKAGVTDIVLTPHYSSPEEYDSDSVKENYHELKEKIKKENIKINIYLGNEVAVYGTQFKMFDDVNMNKLADSKYVLIEFPMAIDVDYVLDAIYEIKIRGLVPIIAHPERCECFRRDYDLIISAINEGALIQCNAGSILGYNGMTAKKIIKRLLKEKKIHFLATDTHSIKNNRYEYLEKVENVVEKLVGPIYKDKLFIYNARDILLNKNIGE